MNLEPDSIIYNPKFNSHLLLFVPKSADYKYQIQNILMENNNKSYQVAYSYQDYLKSATTYLCKDMMRLPSSIPQEPDSTWQITQPKPENIFRERGQSRDKRSDIAVAKGYDCVGYKQVQAYLSKTDKKKRRMNSLLKRTSQSVLSFSRASQSKISEKQYMTKQQVIRSYGKESNKQPISHIEQIYIHDEKSMFSKTLSTQNTTMGSFLHTPEQSFRSPSKHSFSMAKLKQKVNDYKGEWARQLSKKKLRAFEHTHKTVKLDSILKNSESFRKKMQNMELNSISEMNEHLQPKMWTLMLRNPRSIQKPPVVQKVLLTGLGCSGKNKLKKEVYWVQEKDRLGFYFKGKRQAKENIVS